MALIQQVCSVADGEGVTHNFQGQSILILISVDARLEMFALETSEIRIQS